MNKRVVLISAGAVLAVFLGFSVVLALQLSDGSPDYQGTALLGDPVPALELPLLPAVSGEDAGVVALAGLDGVAIVNFFNSWCIPCKEEEPALKAFFAAHRNDGDFQMIGIVRDDTEGAVRKLVQSHDLEWTIVLDPGARASVDFGTTGQPETFAISADGRVVALHRGRATIDDLEGMLAIARRS
ncbi:MAG TPA: TlpA disulfide reductase family protein [Acidimicrobiia bacterium]|nr:TlpA disulfide reductase family protein [Acidimicrobiia bacterium]